MPACGTLDINFDCVVLPVDHKPETIQDVAVEIYALQPCGGRGVSQVMPLELKQKHEQVYNKFNGVGQSAVRDLNNLLGEAGSNSIKESKSVPLFDITSFKVYQVTVRYILDCVCYKEGNRPAPPAVALGLSIFDEPSSATDGQEHARQGESEIKPHMNKYSETDFANPKTISSLES
ncbi:hypothetical protein F443_22768 [Phytophthora nicotianae P1569]|uniref:Uncharacterized protein n=1 Tax=Phytophthora nicotianae P1569 TaxID=1317065 RepID=V9DTZ0_PHYNI|nr:hypothetical protein F443_22768 [Phytophthora nicotianae P1569]